jgi:hypothetical protein
VSESIKNLVHRASQCPVVSLLKAVLLVSFLYALHVAAFHQGDMSHHSFALLVDSVALLAVLTLALHWLCGLRHPGDKD